MGRVRIESTALFLLALGLLILPVKWVLSWALAAAVHELFHYAAIRLLGGNVPTVALGASGAKMEMLALPPGRELLCALAGPLGGLCLVGLGRWMPTVALCALLQSLWNLLPLFPLDGGRALRCGLCLLIGDSLAHRVSQGITWFVLGSFLLFCLYCTVILRLGWLPIAIGGLLFAKIACKPGRSIVE